MKSTTDKNDACILIQKISRGYLSKLKVSLLRTKITSAIKIQKIVRGMLYRLSNQFILTQVYIKLPVFWKDMLNFSISETLNQSFGKKSETSKNNIKKSKKSKNAAVFGDQVKEVRESVQTTLGNILNNVAVNGILAPKLPFVVPQPFDKKPYVSLTDGRKMTFYSHNDSIFKSEKEKVTENSIHKFHITYWPHTEPIERADASTLQHDPNINSFEIIHNYRRALHCNVCDARLRVISCQTCSKGYCFYCAFRVHSDPSRRKHKLDMIEPRIEQINKASASLVYHINSAKSISYDLRYVVKYLKSAKEVKRVLEEKRMAKEYEAEEERRRIEFLKAESEAIEKHDAATKISLLYRVKKAKSVVTTRRYQLVLEKVLTANSNYENIWIPVQKLIRRYLTRSWLYKRGVNFKLKRKRKKKRLSLLDGQTAKVSFAELSTRVDFELENRLLNGRRVLFSKLYEQYTSVVTLLETNINYWLERDKELDPKIQKLVGDKEFYEKKYTSISLDLASISTVSDPRKKAEIEKSQKLLFCNVSVTEIRIENLKNIKWWIVQYARSAYRRLRIIEARFIDLCHRLNWIFQEGFVIKEIINQIQFRLDTISFSSDSEQVKLWLEKFLSTAKVHNITIDSQQESLLLDELDRIKRDEDTVLELDSLLEELRTALIADSQYSAERVYLDKKSISLSSGTDEAVDVAQKLNQLKKKQSQLNNSVIDSLKFGLENKFNHEEELQVKLAAFPTDRVDLGLHDMHTITAELIDQYHSHKNFKVSNFISIFLAQPWLVQEAMDDVKLEENIRFKELELDKLRIEVNTFNLQKEQEEAEMADLDKKISDLEKEVENNSFYGGVGEELAEEKDHRLKILDVLSQELTKRKTEKTLIVKLRESKEDLGGPKEVQLNKLMAEIENTKEIIEIKFKNRNKVAKVFFDLEDNVSDAIQNSFNDRVDVYEKFINKHLKYQTFCHLVESEPDKYLNEIIKKELSVVSCESLGITYQTPKYLILENYSRIRPRIVPTASQYLKKHLFVRMHALDITIKCLQECKEILLSEKLEAESFHSKRHLYEDRVGLFIEHQIVDRRQKALQKELELRKNRIAEMRETRLAAMRLKKEADEKHAQEVLEKKKPKGKPLTQVLKEYTRKTVRGIKDYIRDFGKAADVAMDEEEQRMANTIKDRSKAGTGGRSEGIRHIHFTGDEKEEEEFKSQNDLLHDKGLPYFVKLKKGLGDGIFIWFQKSFDNVQFITNIEFHHKDPGNPLHSDKEKAIDEDFEIITHPKTNLEIWVKRDQTKISAIGDIDIAFTSIEENQLMDNKFVQMEHSLADFDLPDITFWVKKVDKIQVTAAMSTDAVISEFKKNKILAKENPNDQNLKSLVGRLKGRLEQALEKEKAAEITDPLQYSIDLMALDVADLEKWMICYQEIDSEKVGVISLDQIFMFLEETPTGTAKEIFVGSDSLDQEGNVEFGDFVRAVGTYCFFGNEEILRFIFVYADKEKDGQITHEQFIALLNVINPYDKKAARRCLKEIQLVPGKKMTFGEFRRVNDNFPTLFYPAFRLQHVMRTKFLGHDWWFKKLSKYKEVRRKMVAGSKNTDELAELEIKRFKEDKEREQRIKERAYEIKKETSAIRKVILEARQFIDEIS